MSTPDNPFKDQYTANGVVVDFAFTFDVVQNRSVFVYVTAPGNAPDEDTDIQSPSTYVVSFDNPSAPSSPGTVTFNVAPVDGAIVTITPDEQTGVTVTFSNTEPLDQTDLNKGYSQQSSTIDNILQLFLTASLRYNLNENNANLDYTNLIPPLADEAFWRRVGTEIISQDYEDFVKEVEADISEDVANKINAGADNTNFSAEMASNPTGDPYSGSVKTIDANGNIIVGPVLSGFSAFAGASWAQQWSESETFFTDDFGNSGFGARYYSNLANIAASAAGGVIDELRIFDAVSSTTTVDLIRYDNTGTPTDPWENVLENSFSVYLNGERLQDPVAYSPSGTPPNSGTLYSVNIVEEPTLLNPSSITFSPPVPANTEIYIARSEAQGDGASMRRDSNNATFNAGSLVMSRTGDNFQASAGSLVAARDLSNADFLFRTFEGQTKLLPTGTDVDTVTELGVFMTETIGWSNLPPSLNTSGILKVEFPSLSDTNPGGGTFIQTYRDTEANVTVKRLFRGNTWREWELVSYRQPGEVFYTSVVDEPLGGSFLNGQTIVDGWVRLERLAASGSVFISQSGNNMVLENVEDFLRPIGGSSRSLGSFQNDAARNIDGTFTGIWGAQGGSNGTGPFSSVRNGTNNPSSSGGNPPSFGNYTFSTANIGNSYPVAAENRPKNYALNLAIYHGVVL